MVYLPLELLNIIFSYVPRPSTNKLIKYLINDCYEEDYEPYYAETWYDNYCYNYTFKEWYFFYRKWLIINIHNKKKVYKYTPYPTYVGIDKLFYLL